MRILFLSRWFPYPPNNGSKIRVYNLLRGLAHQHQITLLSFAEQSEKSPDISALQSFCREIQVIYRKPFYPHSGRARLGFFSLKPRSVIDTFSSEMAQRVEQTLSASDYDIAIASEIDMAIYSQNFGNLPAVLDELQVGVLFERFALASSWRRRLRNGLTWAKHRRYLASILKNFQACIVASSRERQLLPLAVKDYRSVEVIPNSVDLASYSDVDEAAEPNTLIYTGSLSFTLNFEAMVWFTRQIYPHIQAQVPEVRLSITGDHAGRSLPPARNVTLTGFVDDVRPLVARTWVSVVPLLTGGGTRLKILEAMALGTPVVSTSKGAEGLDVEAGKHLLIADTPELFAQHAIRLLKEPELRRQLADNAYELLSKKYDWAVVMPRFLDLIERIAHT